MKKMVAFILCVVMLLSMTACSNNTPETLEVISTEPVQTEPVQANTNDGVTNLNELRDIFNTDVPDSVMEKAARLSADINSYEVPDESYWQECLQFLIHEVDREDWDKVLNCMEWGEYCVNTFNVSDMSDYTHKYYLYSNGSFTLMHTGQWHTPLISYNIEWVDNENTSTAHRINEDEAGYTLMSAPNWGVYIIEITNDYPTLITTLSQPSNDKYLVNGPWVSEMVDETYLANQKLFAEAKEIFNNLEWGDGMSNQEYWDEFMTFVVENVPSVHWHQLFSELNGWAYSSAYDYKDINTFNITDPTVYNGDVDQWRYADGEFTLPAGSHHYVDWSYNINWDTPADDYEKDRHATLADPNKDGVILMLFGDYFFYTIELSHDKPTNLTNLVENFEDEFSILFWSWFR